MNWLLAPTLLLAGVLYWAGCVLARRLSTTASKAILLMLALALSIPAASFTLYYTGLLHEPLWLYRWRALPFTELSAAGAGLLAGLLQGWLVPRIKLSRAGIWLLLPTVLAFGLAIPYLKLLLRPLDFAMLNEQWSDNVCLQSSPSTCGPACVATLLRTLGIQTSELELAREAFTSKSGTENWYLARACRRRGARVEFLKTKSSAADLPWPAMAGVRLSPDQAGHFITILQVQGDRICVGDPLSGREWLSRTELGQRYSFTGFFMSVKRIPTE